MSISANFPNVRPSLLLDFANSQQLDSRVTFSRSTTAPYYDGKTSALAEQNLLLQSQNFATTWSNSGVASISTTATTAPDGTSTGNSITEDTSTGVHRFNQTVTTLASTSYVFSIYLKYSNCQYVSLINSPVNNSATFDLVNGTVTTSSGTLSNFITNVGNGWYRVGYVVNNLNAGSTQFFVQMMDSTGTTNNYTGTSRLIYTWGAQLEQRSSVTAYNATTTTAITNYIPQLLTAPINQPRFDFNPTTGESLGLLIEQSSTNLLTYSQDFSNAVWTKTNTTVTTGANIASDGTQTFNLLQETTATGQHYAITGTILTSGTQYTTTIYAKAYGQSTLGICYGYDSGGANFNLSTGAVGTVDAGVTATITAVGNGVYRCSMTRTPSSNSALIFQLNGKATSYTGNGYSGIYIWGAQLEALAFPTSYIPTTSAQVTRASDNASMTGTNFSSWYNNGQGTLYVEQMGTLLNGVTNNTIGFALNNVQAIGFNQVSATSRFFVGSTTITTSVGVSSMAFYKVIGSYNFNNTIASECGNGGTVYSATVSAQTADSLKLPIYMLTGLWIKKLAYYPQALTSTQLQSLTGS